MRRAWLWTVLLSVAGCADSASPETLGNTDAGASACTNGVAVGCSCSAGQSLGTNACGAPCNCTGATDAGGFSLPDATGVSTGAPTSLTGSARPDCEPGLYLGGYDCTIDLGSGPIPLSGTVSFELEVNTQTQSSESCQEFCQDLVISEGKGTLFGVVFGVVGFRTALRGGLDCQTGEFRAEAADGIYGFPVPEDPNDPEGQWSVADPPFGTFEGDMEGIHTPSPPQKIEGTWGLADVGSGVECTGPFAVTHTP